MACAFQTLSPKMGGANVSPSLTSAGWGHGFFHLMLAPFLHFLMSALTQRAVLLTNLGPGAAA